MLIFCFWIGRLQQNAASNDDALHKLVDAARLQISILQGSSTVSRYKYLISSSFFFGLKLLSNVSGRHFMVSHDADRLKFVSFSKKFWQGYHPFGKKSKLLFNLYVLHCTFRGKGEAPIFFSLTTCVHLW